MRATTMLLSRGEQQDAADPPPLKRRSVAATPDPALFCVLPAAESDPLQDPSSSSSSSSSIIPAGLVVGHSQYGACTFLDPLRVEGPVDPSQLTTQLVRFSGPGVIHLLGGEHTQQGQDPDSGLVGEAWRSAKRITLHGIQPPNKTPWREFASSLRSRCQRQGTHHILYDHSSGIWVFEIPTATTSPTS